MRQEIIEVTLHKIVRRAKKEEIIREQGKDGLIFPIHRKGD
jgi:hypothetical protein